MNNIDRAMELRMIRLHTDMENAIGMRDFYLIRSNKTGNRIMFEFWDTTLDCIINEILDLHMEQQ